MKNFTIYNNDTGLIISTGRCQDPYSILTAYDNSSVVEFPSDINTQYVLGGVVTDRVNQMILVDKNTLKNVSEDTEVYVDGDFVGLCTSGEIVLDKVNEGDIYRIKLKCFPFLDYEVEV